MTEPLLRLPNNNTRWVWEIEKDHARVLVEVVEVRLVSGGEPVVMTRSLPDSPIPMYEGDRERPIRVRSREESWNQIRRFWEACGDSPVGGRLTDLSNPISIEQYEGKEPIAEEEHHLH